MCGIFAYIGPREDTAKLILSGLKKLEYRGYDSWGIAVEQGGGLLVEKRAGKIGNAKPNGLPRSNFGFGHTRWATHGPVTDTNAHPHFDCSQKIAIIHNGIVENYQELKKLLKHGHKIVSDTDTEIVAHLIEEYRKRYPLKEAVRQVFLKCRGLSAFLVAEGPTKTLVAVKNGSPIVIGVGLNENFIGSDVNCLLALTKRIIFLEDETLAQITDKKVQLFDVRGGMEIKPKIQTVNWKESAAVKGAFPHFMLKEIYEQPKVIENILLNFGDKITHFSNLFKRFSKIYLVGCGTAHYAAMTGAYLLAKIAKREALPVPGSEFSYKEPFLDKKTLVTFLSQSGETIDITEPLKKVKEKKIKTAALVNVFGSSLYRLADEKIWLEAGPERCVLSTKAFTAKLAVLGLIAFDLKGERKAGEKLLSKAPKVLRTILDKQYQRKYVDPLVKKLYTHGSIYVIGRGASYPIGLEAALKIKEVSYIHVEGFAAGELKHGVIALIENGSPCLVFAPSDETYEATLSAAMEIKSRGGYMIGISDKPNEIFDFYIPVEDVGVFTTIPQIVVAQLLAYKLGVIRGCDPDQPRNLAKSVTVK